MVKDAQVIAGESFTLLQERKSMKFSIDLKAINLESLNENAILLLGYLIGTDGDFELSKASASLGKSREEINKALGILMGCGIAIIDSGGEISKISEESPYQKAERAIPGYTGEELAQKIEDNKEISSLIDYCQKTLQRIFTPTDISEIVYLVDKVGFTTTMVMKLVKYFSTKGKTGVRYISKAAISIFDEGVESDEALDEYIRRKTEVAGGEAFVKSLIGAGSRKLTKKERDLVEKWFLDYKLDKELVKIAYERTINAISKPSLAYMATIIDAWVKNKCTTVEDVEKCDTRPSSNARANKSDSKEKSVFNLEDFNEASFNAESADKGKTINKHTDETPFFD